MKYRKKLREIDASIVAINTVSYIMGMINADEVLISAKYPKVEFTFSVSGDNKFLAMAGDYIVYDLVYNRITCYSEKEFFDRYEKVDSKEEVTP